MTSTLRDLMSILITAIKDDEDDLQTTLSYEDEALRELQNEAEGFAGYHVYDAKRNDPDLTDSELREIEYDCYSYDLHYRDDSDEASKLMAKIEAINLNIDTCTKAIAVLTRLQTTLENTQLAIVDAADVDGIVAERDDDTDDIKAIADLARLWVKWNLDERAEVQAYHPATLVAYLRELPK